MAKVVMELIATCFLSNRNTAKLMLVN